MREQHKRTAFDLTLGHRLRLARQARHMSQEQLGQGLGVSLQQIQKYERGINRLSPERIARCAVLLRVPVGYFFEQKSLIQNMAHDTARQNTDDFWLHTKLMRIEHTGIHAALCRLIEEIAADEHVRSKKTAPEKAGL